MKVCYGQKGDGATGGIGNTINVRYSGSDVTGHCTGKRGHASCSGLKNHYTLFRGSR